ncbi:uncharacterized protein L201_003293 [Kwoniella dendrophila CBS 6074]|uniref:Protein CPL1-like domain-containing protein n=1 Tax=Kwoniella dendrophila CBS 6074 TaxID=1295534 RepID=A0AAX4JSJ9_9TREE
MLRILSTLTILFTLNIFHVVSANDLPIGCYTYQPAGVVKGTTPTHLECTRRCEGFIYALRHPNSICTCSNVTPTWDRQPARPIDNCPHYSVHIVKTTFDSTTCYQKSDFINDGSGFTNIPSAPDCLNQCKFNKKAIFISNYPNPGFSCGCADNVRGTTVEFCGPVTYYVFNHPAQAAVSGLARRKAKEQALIKRNKARRNQFCPSGLEACLIPGLEEYGAWECIDSNNDLESCGGCISGSYLNTTTSVGENCLKPGVSLGAATCVAGQCQTNKCQYGYQLVDNQCVKQVRGIKLV